MTWRLFGFLVFLCLLLASSMPPVSVTWQAVKADAMDTEPIKSAVETTAPPMILLKLAITFSLE